MAVHRVLALLLIQALIATAVVVSPMHTHAYPDHDHPEHHHGLSVHDHHTNPARPDGEATRLQECDPGQHTVSFEFVCAAALQVHVVHAQVGLPALLTPELRIEPTVGDPDVRVHGPPPRTHASPRAPPLKCLA